ncbi:PREDICTED: solute carrier family 22 member 18 [Condylura cristata]|uniref:solute carrier family 22 member 18 n=1 Tax=Condylura cristata TaxID=143302 RepID=UPI00064363ED|nr:PREDICTED: solute carrier family 22 member 18 [Condylura cristata]
MWDPAPSTGPGAEGTQRKRDVAMPPLKGSAPQAPGGGPEPGSTQEIHRPTLRLPHEAPWPAQGPVENTALGGLCYLARSLGLGPVAFGHLQTTFGLLQLLGGPVFGRFADQRGARAAFTLSFLATPKVAPMARESWGPRRSVGAAGAVFPGNPGHYWPSSGQRGGVDRQALPGTGLGGGGRLAEPARQCGVGSGARTPSRVSGPHRPDGPRVAGGDGLRVLDLKAITRLLLLPGVLPVFLVKVASGFPSGLFMVMFSVISMDFFQLGAAQAGYLGSFFGVLQMVSGGRVPALGRPITRPGPPAREGLALTGQGCASALMSSVIHFCLLMPGLVFSLCALSVVTDSMLTKAVSAADTGTMLGLCATVQPLTRTLGPTLGGLLYRSFGVSVFGHVQFAVNFLVLLALWRQPVFQKMDKVQ